MPSTPTMDYHRGVNVEVLFASLIESMSIVTDDDPKSSTPTSLRCASMTAELSVISSPR